MNGALRKIGFAVPFGCLAAISAHAVRFGDDHAFGGDANEALVAAAIGGSTIVALSILHAFLTAGTTIPTGTIAAARAGRLIPGFGALFLFAAGIYYGIESLEGHGVEIGLPTLVLAGLTALLTVGLRIIVALLAAFVAGIVRAWLAFLERCRQPRRRRTLQAQPIHSQVTRAARRFGRAPPNGRRLR
jgi:hypothetical protein